ncbi:MAG: ABC transporter permease [Saprospiraceae bacterium]|nr:ABC transporter permease [Saprospiraceae bacterium]
MIRQNIIISWRNLRKNKGFALINIGGLSLGILVTMLISLWVWDELTFNKSFANYDRIAQAMQNQFFGDQIRTSGNEPMQLAPELRAVYGSFFDQVVTTSWTGDRLLSYGDKQLYKSGNFIEPGITDMLSLKMIQGDRSGLIDPSSILLSESAKDDIFGYENPMGKSLRIKKQMDVVVAGIYQDLPDNTRFADLKFIAPWELLKNTENYEGRIGWGNNWFNTYVQLKEGVDIDNVSSAIRDIKYKNSPAEYAERSKPEIFLHPMPKWHLFSRFENGVNTGGRVEYVRLFSLIGIFVLLLACINFMNLSTARSQKRAKEVGIRKTIGSERSQLISQFLSESFLVVLFSFVFATLLAKLSLPFFNQITEKTMHIPWDHPRFWIFSILFIMLTAIVAGSYPAFYLSSFKPLQVIQGIYRKANGAFTIRRTLVTLQFIVSIALIIGTIIIYKQIQFAKNRPVGYNQDNIVTIPIKTGEIMKHFETLKNELLSTGQIDNVVASDVKVTSTYTTNSGFYWEGKAPGFSEEFFTLRATHGFGDLVDWEIKEGRDFSREHSTDSLAFILNETAVEYMGLEHPIGTRIQWGKDPGNGTFQVIGVVKDMITTSPYSAIKPMIFILHYGRFINYINLKINPGSSVQAALSEVEKIYKKYDPKNPFDYQFLDQEYAQKFGDEKRLAKLAGSFAILAIIISCLGLLGMASFVTEQRKKEIGVRKVLGASTIDLWSLVSKEFLLIVSFSGLVAAPLAYYYMDSWLSHFEYRTEMRWGIFAAGCILALVITILTVSIHTLKAALSNPVEALRNE